MRSYCFTVLSFVAFTASACSDATMSGASNQATKPPQAQHEADAAAVGGAPKVPVTPVASPTPGPTADPVTPPSEGATTAATAEGLPPCVNSLQSTGVEDPNTGLTYILLSQPLNYCDGARACANLGPNGQYAVLNTQWPDAMLKCSVQLGNTWAQPTPHYAQMSCSTGLNLFNPGAGQAQDPSILALGICTF